VKAKKSGGKAGKKIKLKYTVVDASGQSIDRVVVKQGKKKIASFKLKMQAIPENGKRVVKWASKGYSKGSDYSFCAKAADPAGNKSKKSCAKIKLK